ncbi:MAG: hypothetical protein RMJ19_08750, partial [Gemmatales bacterium]|nr:hypothetical protein [Gemmatales bacterium]MDW8175747.1 hypothetical protein [Gemmatales bacterium]
MAKLASHFTPIGQRSSAQHRTLQTVGCPVRSADIRRSGVMVQYAAGFTCSSVSRFQRMGGLGGEDGKTGSTMLAGGAPG